MPPALSPDLDPGFLQQALADAGCSWRDISVSSSVASTNTMALAAARAGAATGTTFIADHQDAGRGRLDRTWVAPPGTSAMFSVVLRVAHRGATGPALGLLPLVAGVAVAAGVARVTELSPVLKWPNDVMLPDPGAPTELAKFAGILAESDPTAGAVVIGIGINVSMAAADLPAPGATSLALAGANAPRARIIAAVLDELQQGCNRWAVGEPVMPGYRARCATLGRDVEVLTPTGPVLGRATDVGPDGELVVVGPAGETRLFVGDVTHVRHGR